MYVSLYKGINCDHLDLGYCIFFLPTLVKILRISTEYAVLSPNKIENNVRSI